MSKQPPKASTRAPATSWPMPTRTAEANTTSIPVTVTRLGVTGRRAKLAASRWALRLTQAWNRLVNTSLLLCLSLPAPGLLINLEDLAGHLAPGVTLSLGQAPPAQPRAQLGIAGQPFQGHGQLG